MALMAWSQLPLRVLWTRGAGCADLARLLDPDARRVDGDLDEACIEHRTTLVVRRRLRSRFDLTRIAVPHDIDLESMGAVVALVGGGPNSALAAEVTARIAEATGVPGRMVCAYRTAGEQAEAITTVENLFGLHPSLEYRTLEAAGASEIMATLGPGDLAVLGAPAGNWLQRQVFGTGARLLARAPAGAVVVRDAPIRAYQVMEEPAVAGPLMGAGDAELVFGDAWIAVVDEGRLVGVVPPETMSGSEPSDLLGDLAVEVDAIAATDAVPEELDAPVPVTDRQGRLMGLLAPRQ